MNLLAIDPGAKGGFAGSFDRVAFSTGALPDTEGGILETLRSFAGEGSVCYLEDLVKYAGRNMPSSSMAVYAGSWGFLKGCLMALGFQLILVKPQAWQKALGLGTAKGLTKTEWKRKLRDTAEKMYPGSKVTLANADALLMLRYASIASQPRKHVQELGF